MKIQLISTQLGQLVSLKAVFFAPLAEIDLPIDSLTILKARIVGGQAANDRF